jgi:hypothetical protein
MHFNVAFSRKLIEAIEFYRISDRTLLLGQGDLRSIHRYERGKQIMREAVGLLENPPKILSLACLDETKKAVNY